MKVNAHFYPEIALFSTKAIYAHAKITRKIIRDFFSELGSYKNTPVRNSGYFA